MKSQGMLISALVFAFVVALFAVINVESVQVNFLFAKPMIPLILVILASTLFGGAIVGSIGMIRQFKLQRTIKSLEKQLHGQSAGAEASSESGTEAPFEATFKNTTGETAGSEDPALNNK